jgi:hypothetical protein
MYPSLVMRSVHKSKQLTATPEPRGIIGRLTVLPAPRSRSWPTKSPECHVSLGAKNGQTFCQHIHDKFRRLTVTRGAGALENFSLSSQVIACLRN